MNFRLYLVQRATAVIMIPLVLVHLGVVFYASASGLSAAAILARTRGSVFWALVYGVFAVAAAGHAAIGLRTVLAEWGRAPLLRRAIVLDAFAVIIFFVLATLGLRAVYAVVAI